METIPNATIRALSFHHSLLSCLEEGALQFIDVTDKLELTIEPKNNGQPITDSKDQKVRKRLERAAKRKARHDNFHAPMRQVLTTSSAALLLSGPALLSHPLMPALLSHLGSLIPLSSYLPVPALLSRLPMPALSSRPGSPTLLSFCPPVPALSSLPVPVLLSHLLKPALLSLFMPVLLSPLVLPLAFFSMLDLAPTRLTFSALRILKRALSNEPLRCQLTRLSPPKPLCPFPILGPLPKKSNCKRPFNMAFINSRPLVATHTAKEVDLS